MKLKRLLALVPALLILAACSKVNKQNYDLLEVGMTKEKVEAILGSSDKCSDKLGTENCVWGSEDGKNIKVSFVAGSAVFFSNNQL